MTPNALIMPVTVPSKPSSGDSVMIVSRTGRKRLSRAVSARAVDSMASVAAGLRWRMPAASTRAAGEREVSPRRHASSQWPPAARASTASGSALRARPRQVQARSRITASATTEQAARGIITGPPFTSRATSALIARSPPTSTGVASGPPSNTCVPGAEGRRVGGWLAGS